MSVDCCSVLGIVKTRLGFTEEQGCPKLICSNQQSLTVLTKSGYISTYNATTSDLKPLSTGFFLNEVCFYLKNETVKSSLMTQLMEKTKRTLTSI